MQTRKKPWLSAAALMGLMALPQINNAVPLAGEGYNPLTFAALDSAQDTAMMTDTQQRNAPYANCLQYRVVKDSDNSSAYAAENIVDGAYQPISGITSSDFSTTLNAWVTHAAEAIKDSNKLCVLLDLPSGTHHVTQSMGISSASFAHEGDFDAEAISITIRGNRSKLVHAAPAEDAFNTLGSNSQTAVFSGYAFAIAEEGELYRGGEKNNEGQYPSLNIRLENLVISGGPGVVMAHRRETEGTRGNPQLTLNQVRIKTQRNTSCGDSHAVLSKRNSSLASLIETCQAQESQPLNDDVALPNDEQAQERNAQEISTNDAASSINIASITIEHSAIFDTFGEAGVSSQDTTDGLVGADEDASNASSGVFVDYSAASLILRNSILQSLRVKYKLDTCRFQLNKSALRVFDNSTRGNSVCSISTRFEAPLSTYLEPTSDAYADYRLKFTIASSDDNTAESQFFNSDDVALTDEAQDNTLPNPLLDSAVVSEQSPVLSYDLNGARREINCSQNGGIDIGPFERQLAPIKPQSCARRYTQNTTQRTSIGFTEALSCLTAMSEGDRNTYLAGLLPTAAVLNDNGIHFDSTADVPVKMDYQINLAGRPKLLKFLIDPMQNSDDSENCYSDDLVVFNEAMLTSMPPASGIFDPIYTPFDPPISPLAPILVPAPPLLSPIPATLNPLSPVFSSAPPNLNPMILNYVEAEMSGLGGVDYVDNDNWGSINFSGVFSFNGQGKVEACVNDSYCSDSTPDANGNWNLGFNNLPIGNFDSGRMTVRFRYRDDADALFPDLESSFTFNAYLTQQDVDRIELQSSEVISLTRLTDLISVLPPLLTPLVPRQLNASRTCTMENFIEGQCDHTLRIPPPHIPIPPLPIPQPIPVPIPEPTAESATNTTKSFVYKVHFKNPVQAGDADADRFKATLEKNYFAVNWHKKACEKFSCTYQVTVSSGFPGYDNTLHFGTNTEINDKYSRRFGPSQVIRFGDNIQQQDLKALNPNVGLLASASSNVSEVTRKAVACVVDNARTEYGDWLSRYVGPCQGNIWCNAPTQTYRIVTTITPVNAGGLAAIALQNAGASYNCPTMQETHERREQIQGSNNTTFINRDTNKRAATTKISYNFGGNYLLGQKLWKRDGHIRAARFIDSCGNTYGTAGSTSQPNSPEETTVELNKVINHVGLATSSAYPSLSSPMAGENYGHYCAQDTLHTYTIDQWLAKMGVDSSLNNGEYIKAISFDSDISFAGNGHVRLRFSDGSNNINIAKPDEDDHFGSICVTSLEHEVGSKCNNGDWTKPGDANEQTLQAPTGFYIKYIWTRQTNNIKNSNRNNVRVIGAVYAPIQTPSWNQGESHFYENWKSGQPNNWTLSNGEGQNCVLAREGNEWDDYYCREHHRFACRNIADNRDWQVTTATGDWFSGFKACAELSINNSNYEFARPSNAAETDALKDAALVLPSVHDVWINLNRGSVTGKEWETWQGKAFERWHRYWDHSTGGHYTYFFREGGFWWAGGANVDPLRHACRKKTYPFNWRLSEAAGNWSAGHAACQSIGEHGEYTYAAPRNAAQNAALQAAIPLNVNTVWINWSRADRYSPWRSVNPGVNATNAASTGALVTEVQSPYRNWGPEQPNNWINDSGQGQDCVELREQWGGQWNDQTCSIEQKFVCRNTAATDPAQRWELSNAEGAWEEGFQACRDLGGNYVFAYPENETDNNQISSLLNGNQHAWLNFRRVNSSTEWASFQDYRNWGPEQPNNWINDSGQGQDCVELREQWGGQWNDQTCSIEQNFVCRNTAATDPAQQWVLSNAEGAWEEGFMACHMKNRHYVFDRPQSQSDNNAIQSLLIDNQHVWINFRRSESNTNAWERREYYLNWDNNAPNDHENNEDCAEIRQSMTSGSVTGKWNDRSCDAQQKFVCRNTAATDPDQQWVISNNAGAWQAGFEVCQAQGNHFVFARPQSQNDNNAINSLLNDNQHAWINLSKDQITSQWRSFEDYRNWGMGQPQGNEAHCAKLIESDEGRWQVADCAGYGNYLCRDSSASDPDQQWVISEISSNWQNGFMACHMTNRNYVFARPQSQADSQAIMARLANISETQHVWINYRRNESNPNLWKSHQFYLNWDENEPNGDGNNEDCAEIRESISPDSVTGKWSVGDCGVQQKFVCRNTAATDPNQHWVISDNAGVWQDGFNACQAQDSHYVFARPQSQNDNNAIINRLADLSGEQHVWINYRRDSNIDPWIFREISLEDYRNWGIGQPQVNEAHCANLVESDQGRWQVATCVAHKRFICRDTAATDPAQQWVLSDASGRWAQGFMACHMTNRNYVFALPKSDTDSQAIMERLGEQDGDQSAWINFRRSKTNSDVWGSRSEYLNWANEQPMSAADCATIHKTDGLWHGTRCDNGQLRPYACLNQEADSTYPLWHLVDTAGTWENGSLACGDLAGDYRFAKPENESQNQALIDSIPEGMHEVWINYKDIEGLWQSLQIEAYEQWAANQSVGEINTTENRCAKFGSNGTWFNVSCGNTENIATHHRFACRNSAGRWRIGTAIGPWSNGALVCRDLVDDEGANDYTFAKPTSETDNNALLNALGESIDGVWINYRKPVGSRQWRRQFLLLPELETGLASNPSQ